MAEVSLQGSSHLEEIISTLLEARAAFLWFCTKETVEVSAAQGRLRLREVKRMRCTAVHAP